MAFALRFDAELDWLRLRQFATTVPLLVALRLAVFWHFGILRLRWRRIGLHDLFALQTAVTLSALLFVFVLYFTSLLPGMPRSVFIIDWVLAIFLCGGVMFAARYMKEARPRFEPPTGRRTLLVGAGSGAEQLLRQAKHDGQHDLYVVGIVDDDPSTHEQILHGVPVLGSTRDMPRLVARYRLELVVITVQHATKDQMRELVERCAATGVEYKILPSLTEMLTGPTPGGRLRDVRIEDLLGRQPVTLDLAPVAREVTSRTILITGAAGSIGSELARQLAAFKPARLILFERAESPLYFINLELTRTHPQLQIAPIIGDITDSERVDSVFARFRPDYVFHAAAYKHVPMLEVNVREGVRNNVFGTREVVESAVRYGAAKVVFVSTDKAVNPTSVMGATKRIAERILLAGRTHESPPTEYRVVRFGNVLGSDGSVVPLFQRQLAAGVPLTVTHPEVRRYFMTIPEAVQLLLQTAVLPAAAGRIAMLEMGEPVRILDLAEQMIRLSGLRPYQDVKIMFTGLRPGEKLDEELTAEFEDTVPTAIDKVHLVQHIEPDGAELEAGLVRLEAALAAGNDHTLVREMCVLVPEYSGANRWSQRGDREVPLTHQERDPAQPASVRRPRALVADAIRPDPTSLDSAAIA